MVTPGGANGSATIAASSRPLLSSRLEHLGQVLLELERHLRRELAQHRHEVGQEVRRDRVDDAELERSRELVAPGLRELADARGFLEHPLRLLDDALADRRDGDLGLAALEQRRAELLLELVDRHRQRRLAHEALGRGAAEAPLLRDRDDVAELVERHGPSAGEVPGERLAGLRVLQPEVDHRLEVAELAAAVVAPAVERVGEHLLLAPPAAAMPSVSWISPPRAGRASCAGDGRCAATARSGRPRPGASGVVPGFGFSTMRSTGAKPPDSAPASTMP